MYLPSPQSVLTSGLGIMGAFTTRGTVSKGSCLDYSVEKCLDDDGNVRCSKPFLVEKNGCYNIEWSTDGALSHTTAEVRDAGSGELVFYRDTNGEWKPEKGELVYIDFKPKIPGQDNKKVEYKVETCDED